MAIIRRRSNFISLVRFREEGYWKNAFERNHNSVFLCNFHWFGPNFRVHFQYGCLGVFVMHFYRFTSRSLLNYECVMLVAHSHSSLLREHHHCHCHYQHQKWYAWTHRLCSRHCNQHLDIFSLSLSASLLIRCILDTFVSATLMLMYKCAVSIPFLSIFSFEFLFWCCCFAKKTFEWHVFFVHASLALCKSREKKWRKIRAHESVFAWTVFGPYYLVLFILFFHLLCVRARNIIKKRKSFQENYSLLPPLFDVSAKFKCIVSIFYLNGNFNWLRAHPKLAFAHSCQLPVKKDDAYMPCSMLWRCSTSENLSSTWRVLRYVRTLRISRSYPSVESLQREHLINV